MREVSFNGEPQPHSGARRSHAGWNTAIQNGNHGRNDVMKVRRSLMIASTRGIYRPWFRYSLVAEQDGVLKKHCG